jgi:glycosyl transferase, family 25
MRFIDFFDRAYVINLRSREDRRQEMARELENAGMPFALGKVELFPAVEPESAGSFRSIGCRGCFLSHLNVLKKAKEENLRNILVMEDDLKLRDDFKQYEEAILGELLNNDWDIVSFGYGIDASLKNASIQDESHQGVSQKYVSLPILHSFKGEVIGTHFYAVNGKTLGKLIDFLEVSLQQNSGGFQVPIDGCLNVFKWEYPNTVRLIAVPSFGSQRPSRSDVSTRWFDQVPILKHFVGLVRSLR